MDFHLSLELEKVGSAFPDEPLATTPEATVADALLLMRTQKTGAVLVCNDQGLIGIFTERDALKLMAAGADLTDLLSTVMSKSPATVSADETVGAAIKKMSEGGYRQLPIMDTSRQPIGVAAVRGIVHYLVDHFPETVYNLPPDPHQTQSEREGA